MSDSVTTFLPANRTGALARAVLIITLTGLPPLTTSDMAAAASKSRQAQAAGGAVNVPLPTRKSRTPALPVRPEAKPVMPDAPTPPHQREAAPWSEAEQLKALRICLTQLGRRQVDIRVKGPIRRGACGDAAVLQLKRIGGPQPIEFRRPVQLNCRMIAAVHDLFVEEIQPLSERLFSSPIARIAGAQGYVCRNRNGDTRAKISEHAFANAIDILTMRLANGTTISVLDHWGPIASSEDSAAAQKNNRRRTRKRRAEKERKIASAGSAPTPDEPPQDNRATFLREVHRVACERFGTVLGPNANAAHRNHFHFDLAKRRRSNYCR